MHGPYKCPECGEYLEAPWMMCLVEPVDESTPTVKVECDSCGKMYDIVVDWGKEAQA